MTAHNLPIWKLLAILNDMMDQGFVRMDVIIEDDFTLVIKGIREEERDDTKIKKIEYKKKDKNIDWEDTI